MLERLVTEIRSLEAILDVEHGLAGPGERSQPDALAVLPALLVDGEIEIVDQSAYLGVFS